MSWFPPSLAVGGPGPVLGQGWDAAPILLMVTLVVLMRWARIRIWFVSLLGAVIGGLLLDLVTDALHMSLPTTIAVMCLIFAMVALQRTRAR
jgi:uncharacterized transporter YbjL